MDDYYTNQAGSGISGFSGSRYQRGAGFFGRLIHGGILPILKKIMPYLGKRAVDTGLDIAQDVMDGQNFKQSASKRFKASGKTIATDAIAKVRQMRGGGCRRRTTRKNKVKRRKAVGSRKSKRTTRKKKKAIDFL